MDTKNGFLITERDRVLRAWESSTGLVRDYQAYAKEVADNEALVKVFSQCAEDEARHAATLLDILRKM